MIKINWARVIIGGLVATVILFVTDGFLHERILSADWQAIYHALGATPPQHNPAALIYFVVFELGRFGESHGRKGERRDRALGVCRRG